MKVCDPVEADQYKIGKVAVSNFVLPEWFNTQTQVDTEYDYLGGASGPFKMTAGGYMVVRSPGNDGTEIFSAERTAPQHAWRKVAKRMHPRSRMLRRLVERQT